MIGHGLFRVPSVKSGGLFGLFNVLFAAAILSIAGGRLVAQDAPAGPSADPRPVPLLQIVASANRLQVLYVKLVW